MKVCPKCQMEFADDQKFCSQCAMPLVLKEPAAPAPAAPVPAAPAPAVARPAPAAPAPAAQPVAAAPPAKKRTWLWVVGGLVVGLVILLAAAAVGVFLYLRYYPREEFAITKLRFADSESAPPRASTVYKPEEKVELFYEVPGYELDSNSRVAVVTQNQVLAPGGKPLLETKAIEVKQRVARDAGPVKCRFTIQLPPWAPPGTYTVKIDAQDEVGQKTASTTATFTVNAPPLEISETLVASGLEFSTSRDGAALSPPVFTTGQTIWLRYRVLGIKADEQGRVELSEDWQVLGPDGNPVFQRSDDELVRGQFVYPPSWVPVHNSLALTGDPPPGEYRFQIVLHDKIAGTDYPFEQTFTITKP